MLHARNNGILRRVTPDPLYEGALRRVEMGVASTLRATPIGAELRKWGFSVEVTGETRGVLAQAIPVEGKGWPTLESRITGERWWEPEGSTHIERIANRLAADLRMKWDRWMLGIEEG